jgi:hypothetical protein
MGEGTLPVDIPQSPHMGVGGRQVIVGDDEPALIGLDACCAQVERVGIGHAPDGK